MKHTHNQARNRQRGEILVLTMIILLILSIIGLSMLTIAQSVQEHTIRIKRETAASAAAEAAYEQAVFWMSQQSDMFLALDQATPEGSLTFPDSRGSYQIRFSAFAANRPVFEIITQGQSGIYTKTLRVYVVQAITGWEMGACRIPSGPGTTTEVYFADNEVIAMPLHINTYKKPDDEAVDIHIQGDPKFLGPVSMSESRYSASGVDKYRNLIDVFDNGIYFDQPQSRISDETAVQFKFDWFRKTLQEQKPELIFTPTKNTQVTNGQPAVQLEFFVGSNGRGYIRITNNCTVRGYKRTFYDSDTWDYKITPDSGGMKFEKYPIYGYHYIPNNAAATGQQIVTLVQNTYVTPKYGTVTGTPGGEIFIDGNVIIGSAGETASLPQVGLLNVVQGQITVVASGNIWLADSIQVSDKDDLGNLYPRQTNGLPAKDNPNSLGLVAKGVVKVIDPGVVETLGGPVSLPNITYQPVAILDAGYATKFYNRHLPDPLIVEAAITVGGGGWGAENVARGTYGGRKEYAGTTDDLIVRGLLVEAVRGVVGIIGSDGYVKHYYLDERLTRGIVPGNLWFKGKYVPVPAGWSERRE